MAEIRDAINWWEDDLTPAQREHFLQGGTWEGTVEERHSLLMEFYRRRYEIENPNPNRRVIENGSKVFWYQ